MKELFRGKTWIILLVVVALIGLIILASGLSGMRFDQPGAAGLENIFKLSNVVNDKDVPTSSWLRYLLLGMFIVLFVVFLGPIRPQTNKNLAAVLVRFTLFAFVLATILGQFARKNPLLLGDISTTPGTGSSGAPQPFSAPEVGAQWEFWITSLIVIVIGAAAIVIFNRLIDRWFLPKKGLDEIADIARSTLNDLSNIKESNNAIIRCYTRMNAAVNEHRGISRNAAMTPAEFAQQLENAGLPRESVHGLTRIFERVRYGAQSVGADEIKEAKHCLTSILKASETKQ